MTNRKQYLGRQAPPYLTQVINVRGGYNTYGDPRYRLVWAPHRLTPSGGVWLDWAPGTPQALRDEDKGTKPLRRVLETRMVRRYGPMTGWALEKWVPPAAYGTREQWYSPAVIGGTMLWIPWAFMYYPSQGAYPIGGDYEYASYHFPVDGDLSENLIATAIGRMEQYLDKLPASPLGRVLRRVYVARQVEEAADRAYERWAFDQMSDAEPAFGGGVFSSGAGEKRESYQSQTARRLGFGEHVG